MARKTVWRAVVKALVGEGVDRIFGLPGNPIHLVADLEKHSDIENVAAGLQGLDSSLAGVDTGLAGAAASG